MNLDTGSDLSYRLTGSKINNKAIKPANLYMPFTSRENGSKRDPNGILKI